MQQQMTVKNKTDRLHRRRILLCLPGDRPHIVTQAVYGLANLNEAWIPDEVVVITTKSGAQDVNARLIRQPKFRELCSHIGKSGPAFIELNLEIVASNELTTLHGNSLGVDRPRHDVSSSVLATVQRITDDPNTELRVCIGENGPMLTGFIVGQVMSLLGRSQDYLMQLKLEGVPANSDFFYPDGATDGRVVIDDLSYTRIERVASVRALTRQADYATLCRGLNGQAHLQVRNEFSGLNFRFSNAFDIRCDSSHQVAAPRFEPRAAALYAYYAQRASLNAPYVSDEQVLDEPDDYLDVYESCLVGGTAKSDARSRAARLTRAALRSARSRIGGTLASLMRSGSSYSDYRIYRHRGARGYGLRLSPEQIAIDDSWDHWMAHA